MTFTAPSRNGPTRSVCVISCFVPFGSIVQAGPRQTPSIAAKATMASFCAARSAVGSGRPCAKAGNAALAARTTRAGAARRILIIVFLLGSDSSLRDVVRANDVLSFADEGRVSRRGGGDILEAWTPGTLDIHQISTGRGNAAFLRFPDGTTLLVDAGDVGDGIPQATALPDASRGAGDWIARYIRRMAGADAALDYALVTHFHPDHVGAPLPTARLAAAGYRIAGLAEVAEHVPIRKLIDRGFPDYGEPAAPKGAVFENYKLFAADAAAHGTVRERVRVGRADQIVPVRRPAEYPEFSVRAVAANGEVWTGAGEETRRLFPPSASLPEEDRPAENPCSIALRIAYGRLPLLHGRRPLRRARSGRAGLAGRRDPDREGDREDGRHGPEPPRLDRGREPVLPLHAESARHRRARLVADAPVARRPQAAALEADLARAARRLRDAPEGRHEGHDRPARRARSPPTPGTFSSAWRRAARPTGSSSSTTPMRAAGSGRSTGRTRRCSLDSVKAAFPARIPECAILLPFALSLVY